MNKDSLAMLADSYVSPLLLNTLIREKIPVLALSSRLEEDLEIHCEGLELVDEERASRIISADGSRIYAGSEEALPAFKKFSGDLPLFEKIELLRDKLRFRELLKDIFPDFRFIEAPLTELKDGTLPEGNQFIIKPSKSFCGAGARIGKLKVKDVDDLRHKINEFINEMEKGPADGCSGTSDSRASDSGASDSGTSDSGTSDSKKYIIEEYIQGDEFSCDAYIDSRGVPVILGIYAHPFRDEDDFRETVYYTSPGIVRKILPRAMDFLKRLASRMDIVNIKSAPIPLNLKFRLKKNRLLPIEVNPMSFGGFSLPDLAFFAFNINPYLHYFRDLRPDWDGILSRAGQDDSVYYWVLSGLSEGDAAGKVPDHDKYSDLFEDLIGYCKLDTRRYPAFSIAFGRAKRPEDVLKYLDLDFKEFLKTQC